MEDSANTEHLFVYGTLRTNSTNPMSRLLQNYSRRLGNAYFRGRLYDAGRFPAAVPSENDFDKVHGEILAVKKANKIFSKLDLYEGYDPSKPEQSLFIREKRSVYLKENEQEVMAWIYLFTKSTIDLTEIQSGNYLEYLSKYSS